MRFLFAILAICCLLSCKKEQGTEIDKNSKEIWISAHRGGPYPGYPENAMETFQMISDSIQEHLIIECDVRMTKDSVLILMHDRSLDRTTTGTGIIASKNWNEIKNLFLIDNAGSSTTYRIPKIEDVLEWAKQKNVLLTLDVKRNVPFELVVHAIEEKQAEDVAYIITYSIGASEALHHINSEIGQSVSIRNQSEFDRYKNSIISSSNAPKLAFTGTILSSSDLFKRLEQEGVPVILGTLGNLDNRAQSRGMILFQEWANQGVDIFATDIPLEVDAFFESIQ